MLNKIDFYSEDSEPEFTCEGVCEWSYSREFAYYRDDSDLFWEDGIREFSRNAREKGYPFIAEAIRRTARFVQIIENVVRVDYFRLVKDFLK